MSLVEHTLGVLPNQFLREFGFSDTSTSPSSTSPIFLKEIWKGQRNTVYEVRTDENSNPLFVLKVNRGAGGPQAARREIDVAKRIRNAGIPVVTPFADQVVELGGQGASLWKWLEIVEGPVSLRRMGVLLSALHSVPFDGMRFLDITKPHMKLIRDVNDKCGKDSPIARRFESEMNKALVSASPLLNDPKRIGLTHGNWRSSDVVTTKSGELVVMDLERAGLSSQVEDFCAIALAVKRFGWPPSYYEAFCSGYGRNAPTLDEMAPVVRMRELKMIAWGICKAQTPAELTERDVRLKALSDPNDSSLWAIVPDRGNFHVDSVVQDADSALSIAQSIN